MIEARRLGKLFLLVCAVCFAHTAVAQTLNVELDDSASVGVAKGQPAAITVILSAAEGAVSGVLVLVDQPKGTSVMYPSFCALIRSDKGQGQKQVVCSIGDIEAGGVESLTFEFVSKKAVDPNDPLWVPVVVQAGGQPAVMTGATVAFER